MNIIDGNILDVSEGIICHQVNCKHVAGAGLALQIRNHFPGWYENYCKATALRLGSAGYFHVKTHLWIANLYAQKDYGLVGLHTSYDALEQCLGSLRNLADTTKLPVYFPYGMSCGLGGGNWNIVKSILDNEFPDAFIVMRK